MPLAGSSLVKEERLQRRASLHLLAEFEDLIDLIGGKVAHGKRRDDVIVDRFSGLSRRGGERGTTSGTEPRGRPQRGLALRALFDRWTGGIALVDNPIPGSDLFIEFLVGDARVDLELRRVFHPVGAVLDLLFGESLADPSRDSALPEVVGIEPVGLNPRLLTDLFDSAAQILVRKRTVLVLVEHLEFVDERDIWVAAPGMDIQPICGVTLAPGKGHASSGVLHVRVFVDRDGRDSSREIDITDTQAGKGTDAESGIGEYCKGGFITDVIGDIKHLVDLVLSKEVIRIDGSLRAGADDDVFCPILATPPEKHLECLSVVSEGAFCDLIIVFQGKQQVVNILMRHFGERDVTSFGTQAESIQVADHRSGIYGVVTVFMADERADFLTVGFVDISGFEEIELVFELLTISLDIVHVGHESCIRGVDYKALDSSPTRTTTPSPSDELPCFFVEFLNDDRRRSA